MFLFKADKGRELHFMSATISDIKAGFEIRPHSSNEMVTVSTAAANESEDRATEIAGAIVELLLLLDLKMLRLVLKLLL